MCCLQLTWCAARTGRVRHCGGGIGRHRSVARAAGSAASRQACRDGLLVRACYRLHRSAGTRDSAPGTITSAAGISSEFRTPPTTWPSNQVLRRCGWRSRPCRSTAASASPGRPTCTSISSGPSSTRRPSATPPPSGSPGRHPAGPCRRWRQHLARPLTRLDGPRTNNGGRRRVVSDVAGSAGGGDGADPHLVDRYADGLRLHVVARAVGVGTHHSDVKGWTPGLEGACGEENVSVPARRNG